MGECTLQIIVYVFCNINTDVFLLKYFLIGHLQVTHVYPKMSCQCAHIEHYCVNLKKIKKNYCMHIQWRK